LKILLVRLRLIGDVVFTTPLIAALRQTHPAAEMTYLVEPSAAPVVAHNPHLSNVVTVPHSRGWRRLRDDLSLARRLANARFDLAIDLHGGPRSAFLTWASRAPTRVGYDVPGRSWMYTTVVARPKGYRPRHAVENQWDLIAALGPMPIASPSRDRHPVEMVAGPEDGARLARFFEQESIDQATRLVVIHVSAGNPFRRWPEQAFAALASGLATADPGRTILVTAGPSDRDAAHRVIDRARALAGTRGTAIKAADALSLHELRALCDRAALFIGGDSGPLHIAATSRVPIVGLYGPTLPERSAPWRPASLGQAAIEPGPLDCRPCDQRTCVHGDFRCLASIPAGEVLAAAERLLGATP
jgi:lipopolysaccharide heptosyltransferase II